MRNAEQTKEKILSKSGILFNTQGYKATSLSKITAATGLTKGAIYRHFNCKDQLENEALAYLSGIMFEKLGGLIKSKQSAGEKLRALFGFFETYTSKPLIKGGCPLLNAAIEADDTNPLLRNEALKILGILRTSVESILNKGIKYKQIKSGTDTSYYASVFIASLEGAIMMSKLKKDNIDMKYIIKHLDSQLKLIEI